MFPFDAVTTEHDDLTVLAAYVAAEESAAQARRQLDTQRIPSQAASSTCPAEFSANGHAVADGTTDSDEHAGMDTEESAASPGSRSFWVARLRVIEGIARDRLAPIHGRLIAQGLLQFQLQGRDEGLVYRTTGAARDLLATARRRDADEAEAA